MIIKKIVDGVKNKKILDLKYIIVEIVLIFTGITLAANYNNYQNDLQDQKFLKEVITQIHSEISDDAKFNKRSIDIQEKKIVEYQEFIKIVKEKSITEINSNKSKEVVSDMTNYIDNSNSTSGYDRLKEKNINLIKNIKLKNQLIRYYEMMNKLMRDVKLFDTDKKELKPFVFKYFKNYDYYNSSYDSFTNIDEMNKDRVFLNTINYVISNYIINIDSFKNGGIPESKKTMEALEKEYEFLKKK